MYLSGYPSTTLTCLSFFCAVRLYTPFSMRVAVVYRPSDHSHQFLDHFATWLPHFLSCDIPTLIMSDFNIPIALPLSPSATHLLSLTSSFGLSPLTNSPKHEDGNSLDLVFSRLCAVDDFTNSPLLLSDHNLSFSIKNCQATQVTPTVHTYRNIQAINTQKLMKNLQSSMAPISSLSCPDSALKHYNETLQSALDEFAPPIDRTPQHRWRQPWHTLQTRFLQRCSRCAERLWRKSIYTKISSIISLCIEHTTLPFTSQNKPISTPSSPHCPITLNISLTLFILYSTLEYRPQPQSFELTIWPIISKKKLTRSDRKLSPNHFIPCTVLLSRLHLARTLILNQSQKKK
ncbi:uncharacterized protein [Dendrobates tinctorius]|uniref:uncharacterized protein n=1 Tax=Dendrobates tinctorius TaxID=92724 RepID=UPI003CC9BA76